MSERTIARSASGLSRGRLPLRLVIGLFSALLAVLLVSAAIFAVWCRASFHVWPWSSSLPDRVTYCGRTYLGPGDPVTWTEAEAFENGAIRKVGHYGFGALGWSIYANPQSEQARTAVYPPLPCAMGVYLRTDDDRVAAYTLSGGP
ncbi:hypothetical protein [Parafrankia sp. EUN1f]|uniref:hypothetical protein n=1 Tax=Parafrankia sp. EUN1f TaxID=102897 RepID=UPI0001C44310|nr:hypothetical protein [Parafrankia sp. EUN1f]EFC84172.1 hypothetical protein FrEUN1fDRAFT_2689 [Parafrankia sp. EUN1f]